MGWRGVDMVGWSRFWEGWKDAGPVLEMPEFGGKRQTGD